MKKHKSLVYSFLLFLFLTGLSVSKNFSITDTAELAKYRIGTECCDGWQSKATGK